MLNECVRVFIWAFRELKNHRKQFVSRNVWFNLEDTFWPLGIIKRWSWIDKWFCGKPKEKVSLHKWVDASLLLSHLVQRVLLQGWEKVSYPPAAGASRRCERPALNLLHSSAHSSAWRLQPKGNGPDWSSTTQSSAPSTHTGLMW